jgi:hypothetical protein
MYRSLLCSLLILALATPTLAEARSGSSSAEKPNIISRARWGADEALGLTHTPVGQVATKTPTPVRQLTEKDRDCRDRINKYPEDFKVARTEKGNGNEFYSWERRYSPKVKQVVLHHTGEHRNSEAEKLSGKERVRSIYYSHTVNNGWGDIGYHYVIDKAGKIYEGRAGGDFVVGAHAYCANVATVAVAFIGNFQITYPTEAQLRSGRKLIAYLTDKYGLRANGRTRFQGRSMPTVVAHRDLAATQCAGRKMQKLLPTLRRLVARGDFRSPMLLSSKQKPSRRGRDVVTEENVLNPSGSTTIKLPPRGVATVKLQYSAGKSNVKAGSSLAKVSKSNSGIGIWQKRRGSRVRVRNDIRSEDSIRKGEQKTVILTVLAPRTSGNYTIQIGPTTYRMEVSGRRVRSR